MENIKIETTKKGYPALWESGGASTNKGYSQIITGCFGETLHPIYQPGGGHLCCGRHALFILQKGFYVINVFQRRGVFPEIYIYKIIKLNVPNLNEEWEANAEVLLINEFSEGEWDIDLEENLKNAVNAARDKSCHYHCRSTYYVE